TISATAKWSVRPDVPMIASSVFFRSGSEDVRKARSLQLRGGHAASRAAAPSDDRCHLGYITHFYLDYKMRLIYRFPILTRRGAQPIPRAGPRGGWVGCLTS